MQVCEVQTNLFCSDLGPMHFLMLGFRMRGLGMFRVSRIQKAFKHDAMNNSYDFRLRVLV